MSSGRRTLPLTARVTGRETASQQRSRGSTAMIDPLGGGGSSSQAAAAEAARRAAEEAARRAAEEAARRAAAERARGAAAEQLRDQRLARVEAGPFGTQLPRVAPASTWASRSTTV